MRASVILLIGLMAGTAGISVGNKLVEMLDLDSVPDRTFFLISLKGLVNPGSRDNQALQNAIYQSRRDSLVLRQAELENQLRSVNDYLAPLEEEVHWYRQARTERLQLTRQEQTRLSIDLVSRYRDYHRARQSLDSFVPLAEGESLLATPSVYRDLIVRQGGSLAEAHNHFLGQDRDASFTARYESRLRHFLAQFDLTAVIVECRQTLCELHLSGHWDDPYYQAFEAIYSQLAEQDWYSLERVEHAHQYRGAGVQIQVWMLSESRT